MCKSDMTLSLNSETFASLKKDFDNVLARTIGNMQMKGAEGATLTVKLDISLEKISAGIVPVTKPTFKHTISSVMQVKDKVSGQLRGELALVWDDEQNAYVLRPIDYGQTSVYDNDDDFATVDDDEDKEHGSLAIGDGQKGLPEPGEVSTELDEFLSGADDGYEYDDPED